MGKWIFDVDELVGFLKRGLVNDLTLFRIDAPTNAP